MGTERAAATGLTAAQLMDFWLWLWLGFSEREAALGTRSAAPGTAEAAAQLGVELAALEAVSSQLSAALRAPAPDGSQERTYSRLQGGLAAGSVVRLATWLEEPAAPAAARLRRRASEVLQQVGHSPAPSPPAPAPSISGPGSPQPRPTGASSSPPRAATGGRPGS